jgi:O-methyltransferase
MSRRTVAMVKRILKSIIYTVPGTQALWIRVNKAAGRGPRLQFSGWGMDTETAPPWCDGGGDDLTKDFVTVNSEVASRVAAGRMRLSQFNDVQDKARQIRELMWRHYVVFWSARYAAQATTSAVKHLVECGVCDGLTAYYAMSAVKVQGPFRAFLYDAWEGMKGEYLLDSEKAAVGQYSYLSLENTKRNVEPFENDAVFVKGFIPDSFEGGRTPSEIAWLHIDLNSALPTAAALSALFDRMPRGSVILFDDYGWVGWHDTKVAIDSFLEGRHGLLLPLPTGQAMFFKH